MEWKPRLARRALAFSSGRKFSKASCLAKYKGDRESGKRITNNQLLGGCDNKKKVVPVIKFGDATNQSEDNPPARYRILVLFFPGFLGTLE